MLASEVIMEYTIEKLQLFSTAYSPFDGCYVEIMRVYPDKNGRPLLRCRLQDSDKEYIFRQEELTGFVL